MRRHTLLWHLHGWLAVSWLLFGTAPALADNPIDRENDRLAAEVKRLAKRPEAQLALLELVGHWDDASPKRVREHLEKLAALPSLLPQTRALARVFLADARARLGESDALDSALSDLGYLTEFRVIGPFDNEGKSGFDTETPPEQKRMEAPDLQASYPGRERSVSWRQYPDVVRRGYVSFGSVLRPRENVCGLAETFVHSDRAQPLMLWVGAGGAHKIYWNGEEVLRDAAYRGPSSDRSVAVVGAHAGANRLLVKVCVASGAWGFSLRLSDARGDKADGIVVKSTSEHALDIPKGQAKVRLPKPPVTALQALERAAEGDKPKASALAALARYLRYTASDDPAERRAKQLAARAAELEPTVEHLLLAAETAEQRGEAMRFASKAEALFPDDPRSLLMRARLRASGPVPEDALPLIARIPEGSEPWAAAMLLKAAVLRDLELPLAAQRVVLEVASRVGDTVQLLRRLAELFNQNGQQDRSIEARKRLLGLRYDDASSRRVLITDALQRLDTKTVLEQLDTTARLAPGAVETLLYVAGVYDGLGRDDMVLATHRRAMEIAPEAAEVHVAYGRTLLRAERPELAAEAFFRALELRPQDAATRELLEQLKPKVRDDEAYARSSDQILKSRSPSAGYPITVLTELTVNTVFDNGLGSSFRQHAVQVHDKEGARQYRTYGIQYDPDSQRVELRLARVVRRDGRVLESVRTYEQQLGEPWYRIYYDTRALVVVFPDLEPGDVVEVRYRIDDVAHRNLFADYYGDMHVLRGFSPIAHTEYVLITPASRPFHVREPALPGLRHTQQVAAGRRIDRYVASELPAIVSEAGMPGLTEASPYLHVSTYKSWQDVGRWYWGLIKDQLYADESLKRTVSGLVSSAPSPRDKVARIHNWVVENTRYVGLEFGIHGYLPYRVPLIVQRGFGDCKDKAALLYTMLREAGIDARIVLVRTRRNGAIADKPASLAVFDHAIAYVPELDLYLDGTAEHSGTTELPSQDQGVTVLVVGPDGAELRTTPVLPPERNKRTRALRVKLAADGSAQVAGDEEVIGSEAAGYRSYYEAPGTRAERFERALGSLYPGLKLETQSFEALDRLETPVRYRYEAFVPQLARLDGPELRVAPSVLSDLVEDLARLPSRRHVLDLGAGRLYVEERTVELPAGMRAVTVPSGGEASSPYGKLRLDFTQAGGSVTARTELRVERDRIAPTEYPAFRRWVEEADQLLKQRIGIRREGERARE